MQRLNAPLDVDFVNNYFFPHDIDDLNEINTGRCFLWAYITFHLFQDVQLWDMGAHAFVRYRGKFYDSVRPLGVEDYRDLPATNFGLGCGCSRCLIPAKRSSVNDFKKFWGGSAKRYNVKWSKVRKQVEDLVTKISLH